MIYRLVLIVTSMVILLPASSVHSQTAPPFLEDDGGYHLTQSLDLEHIDENGEAVRGQVVDVGWVNVLGFELRGRTGPFQFSTGDDTAALWCTGGSERFADARIDLPHNVELRFFRMWGFDNSATHDMAAFLRQSCLPNVSAGNPVSTVLAQLGSSGSPGTFTETISLFADAPVTDTQNCNYFVRVRFASGCADSGQLTVRKLRVEYVSAP